MRLASIRPAAPAAGTLALSLASLLLSACLGTPEPPLPGDSPAGGGGTAAQAEPLLGSSHGQHAWAAY